jgi:hypothetical protein
VHRHPGGFVEHQQITILEKNAGFNASTDVIEGKFDTLTLSDTDWWKTNHITGIQTILSFDPTTIATHLAGPQYAINVAFRNTLEAGEEEVIDALAVVLRMHFYPMDGCVDRAGIHPNIIAVSPIKLMISLSVVIVIHGGLWRRSIERKDPGPAKRDKTKAEAHSSGMEPEAARQG